jgi:hypothetical protein
LSAGSKDDGGPTVKLAHFEVTKIGSQLLDWGPPFTRCELVMKVRDEDSLNLNLIKIDLCVSFDERDEVGNVREKILAEGQRILEAAANLAKGKDLQALSALLKEDKKEYDELQQKDWDQHVSSHPLNQKPAE